MVRWPWRKDGSGTGPAPAGQASAGHNVQAPLAADSTRPPTAPGLGGTWQEVFRSGNATATNGGIAVSGIYTSTVQLPPEALRPPAQVDAPTGLDDLPHRPGLFVGRGDELDRLDAALAVPGAALGQVVHGLGGIGKSTLAAHWAATHPHGRTPIRWITADSPAAVQQGLADLATALQPTLAGVLPLSALAEWALQWLASHSGWLLILDNVNDPADIAPLLARASPRGRFLITSRLATPWHDIPTVRLDILDEADALTLLTRTAITSAPGRDLDGAGDLCAELGHLPLAVEQAAAYLVQSPFTTPRAYLAMLTQHPAEMYRTGATAITPTERTIARIWHVTLDRITTRQPLSADLLRLMAWYAPNQIPLLLLDGLASPPALNAALGLLTAYSMITPDLATGTLAIHPLVQGLARTPDPDDLHRAPRLIEQARTHAATQMDTVLPATWDTPATWPTWRLLLPHAAALTAHAPADSDTTTTAAILNRTGNFLDAQGQPWYAVRVHRRALATRVRLLGEDHPDTLTSHINLAASYQSAGGLGNAIELYEQALPDMVRLLGNDHRITLTCRSNLAAAYQAAGGLDGDLDLDRVINLHEQVLAARVRLLGEDHPDTLTSRINLAAARQAAEDDLDRVIEGYELLLADSVRALGENHPVVLICRGNLAGAHQSAGHLDRAIELFDQVLADSVRLLGETHLATITCRSHLADAYKSAGALDRAIALYEQVLADRMPLLGKYHPDSLATRHNLAAACKMAGRTGRSIELHTEIRVEYDVGSPDSPRRQAIG